MTTIKPKSFRDTVVICEPCGTVVEKPTDDEAEKLAERHNELRHDGTDVAVAITEPYELNPGRIDRGSRAKFLRKLTNLVEMEVTE